MVGKLPNQPEQGLQAGLIDGETRLLGRAGLRSRQACLDRMEEFIRYDEETASARADAASSMGSMQILDALFESVSSGKPARSMQTMGPFFLIASIDLRLS